MVNIRKLSRRYAEGKARAYEKALEYQRSFGERNYSWGEIADLQSYFEKLGRRYGLLREFRENAIC